MKRTLSQILAVVSKGSLRKEALGSTFAYFGNQAYL